MQRYHFTLALFAIFVTECNPSLSAQPVEAPQGQGTNYDPPPPVQQPPPPVAPEADQPLIPIRDVDWSAKDTWVKLALFVGSIVLARRAFREMKNEDDDE